MRVFIYEHVPGQGLHDVEHVFDGVTSMIEVSNCLFLYEDKKILDQFEILHINWIRVER